MVQAWSCRNHINIDMFQKKDAEIIQSLCICAQETAKEVSRNFRSDREVPYASIGILVAWQNTCALWVAFVRHIA